MAKLELSELSHVEASGGSRKAVLFIASSDVDSNLFHATRFLAGDPFIYLELDGRKVLLTSELELGRARRQARVDRVVSMGPYETRLRQSGAVPRTTDVLDLFLREAGVVELEVPSSFPLGHAERLREKGYRVEAREDPFYPERTVKTPQEIECIAEAQRVTEEAMALAISMIAESRIEGARLTRGGRPLTAESVQGAVRKMLLEREYFAAEVIVAGGEEGCDPHVRGSGPLPAHATIVLDIFPRSLRTRYWGDMTRTVLRGTAPEPVRKLYRDVAGAHALAVSLLRPGAEGMDVHQAVMDFFKARGNESAEVNGRMQGFIHGTGHGVGLDIHEPPRISRVKATLQAGNVVTVEPGLYYPGVGAVRLEDLVVVEEGGARNLNALPKVLEV